VSFAEKAQQIADLLDDDDDLWQLVADAIASSRDRAARVPDDRDSGDVVDDLIAALRAAT
jgi:hypothetical protein